MRRFKTTPQKKLLGMIILFVLIPLFLLWFTVFVLEKSPGLDTIAIIVAVALLAFWFYRKYKKQVDALSGAKQPEEPLEEDFSGEETEEDFPDKEIDEDFAGEGPESPVEEPPKETKPAPKKAKSK